MKSIIAAITVALLSACATTPTPSVYGKIATESEFLADKAACQLAADKALKPYKNGIFSTSEQEARNEDRTKAAQRACLVSRGYVAQQ